MGEMRKMSPGKGDEKVIEWDSTDPESVSKAAKRFEKLKNKGYKAFRITERVVRHAGEQIDHFDPNAEEILMVPAMQGG